MNWDQLTLWSAIVSLGGALGLAAYFRETLREFLPTPRRLARWLKQDVVAPPAETHFTVLIADLKRDTNGSQTDHVAAALAPYRGIDVVRVGPGPEWEFGSRAQLETQARRLLEARGGDILIFGEVAKADERLRLHILGSHASSEGKYGTYALEKAELPIDFGADFNGVLLAAVAAHVAPATERAGTYLVELLRPAAEKLQRLCERMPAGLDADERGSLWHSLGIATGVLGEQSGEETWLFQAVEAFRAALEELARVRVPLDWAGTQNNLGAVLRILGERESGTALLEEAVAAYRAALEERSRERVPLDWAMTQNNLGAALQTLGGRETGTARLEEAVAAYRAALEAFEAGGAAYYAAGTSRNLERARALIEERQSRSTAP